VRKRGESEGASHDVRSGRPASACRVPTAATGSEIESGGGIWPVFIALQLVLFACFLTLIGLSPPTDRTERPAVAAAAAATPSLATGAPAPEAPEDGPALAASQIPRVDRALAALSRLLPIEELPTGDELRVGLPAGRLFASGGAELLPAGLAAAERIAATLSEPAEDVQLTVTLLLTGYDGDDAAAWQPRARGRCAAFARALAAHGAPAGSYAVGLGRGDAEGAVLAFRAVQPPAPPPAPPPASDMASDAPGGARR
jgi:hypothetical protein